MKIGDLAKQTGLAPSRIRFYESIGLLTAVERKANGYRTYPPDAAVILGLIATAQKAGFTLDEIRVLLPSDLKDWDHDALIGALTRKVADIEALEGRLAQNKAQLRHVIESIETRPADLDCADNARRVLTHILNGDEETADARTGSAPRSRPMASREPSGAARARRAGADTSPVSEQV
ncbi:MerR family transcriptional regulator [Gluconacetobacter diazotrophicus]|uniref:MerR family transcriptional regulator n=2 Tax=Gluconacetobacter diazotrophicus TaxID=33996 RepID=A0A7W4NHT1_GLUDI|nr:MerR family transcriptional regulator [Gluconacetobacter diazotrophicus]MBB2157991.1 MerR family transcriptional regulator [Gluconacetobacter diazotrophicus]CAP54027.1 putative transcriptional regulator, MerR family [Gluconacetobacter diazotrophicus PA1 5]